MSPEVIAALVSAICYVESAGKTNAISVDDGGSASYGECQIKLATARGLGFKGPVSQLWFDSRTNRLYAEKYLRYQLGRYRDRDRSIAAFNAGSVGATIKNRAYVRKVVRAIGGH